MEFDYSIDFRMKYKYKKALKEWILILAKNYCFMER